MTGPRSKGCITCVERRVKCDQTQPQCRRCEKTGVDCKGYARPLTIVYENTRVVRGARGLSRKDGTVTCRGNGATAATFSLLKRRAMLQRAPELLNTSPSMLTDDLFMNFLLQKLTHGKQDEDMESNLRLVRNATTATCILSFTALAEMFFSKTHNLPEITLRATARYSEALRSLAEDLKATELSLFTVTAMTALSMYELVAFTTNDAWINHGRGVAKYMLMLGPQAFNNRAMRPIFQQNRLMLISRAVMCRERTYLAKPEWKTLPWQDEPQLKMSADSLLDIVSDISCILADIDSLRAFVRDVTRVQIGITQLGERLSQSFTEIDSWWKSWSPANLHKCWKVPVDPATTLCTDQHGLFFDECLEFDTFWTCHSLMSYNAARILLLKAQRELLETYGSEEVAATHPPNRKGSHLLGLCNDVDALHRELFQCLDYCDRQSRSFASTFCVMFPMHVAAWHCEDESREEEWMCRVCKVGENNLHGYVVLDARVSMQRVGPANTTIQCGSGCSVIGGA